MVLFYVLSFFKKWDIIQGGTLFKGGPYLRKYGRIYFFVSFSGGTIENPPQNGINLCKKPSSSSMRDQNREGIQIPLISSKKPSSASMRQSSQNREGMNIGFVFSDNLQFWIAI